MSLATSILIKLIADQAGSVGLVAPGAHLQREFSKEMATGTGATQADLMYTGNRVIGATTNDDIDLAGSLVDALGATLTFAKVKLIYLENPAANDGDLVLGGASTPFLGPFQDATDKIAIKPGGVLLIGSPVVAGWAVTGGSADLFRVRNGGSASRTIPIVIIGTSA